MITVRATQPFKRRGQLVNPGDCFEIPADVLPKLAGYVERAKVIPLRPESRPLPRVWLDNGELKSIDPVDDMADEIVKLTGCDLLEQRRLLLLHCQKYDEDHFFALGLKWELRATTLEKMMPRILAEIQAAIELNLLAFLDKLKNDNEGEMERHEELP